MTLLKDDPSWVGCYRLESRLGSGGMGVVYRAYSESGQAVALKVIRRQWVEDREFRARFEPLDADTGRTLWSRLLPDIAFPEVPLFQVVQLVRGQQTLYITDPVKNEIVAVNVATRSTRWKRPLRTGETLAATPDGLYALQTPTKRGQHPRRTAITTIEPATGHTAWTTTKNGTLDFAASVPGALYLAERTSRVNGEARHTAVMRLDTRTRADVRVPVPGGFRCRFAPSITQGATDHYGVADGNTFYLQGDTGETIVVNTQSKSTRRHREPDTPGTLALPTLLDNQLLYSTSYGEVIATNTHRGEQLWRTHRRTAATKRTRPPLSPVMVVNGKLYAVSARSSVFTIDASP